jgi:GT2 family glycosyltransferase
MADALSVHDFVTGPLELSRLNAGWLVESRGRAFQSERSMFEDVFPFASSCNLGLRRSAWDRVGGFDPAFRVGEDIDLSLRLWRVGIAMYFEPRAVVHYRYRPTLRSVFRQARLYGQLRPVIAERLRRDALATPRRMAGMRNWLWLLRHLPMLGSRAGRARWLWVAGNRVGSLQGSWRVRRLYL